MPDSKVTINLTQLVKIIIFTVSLLGLGIPAFFYMYNTYKKINYMYDAFYNASNPENIKVKE